MSLPSQVVAIVEDIAARADELEHALDMRRDRRACTQEVFIRVGTA